MLPDVREIKLLRKSHDITQSQLAKLAGVSQSFIAKVESGLIDPSYHNFRLMYDALTGMKAQHEHKAGEFMSEKLISVGKNSFLTEVVKKMKQHNISQLPVMDDRANVIGLVSESDIIKSVYKNRNVRKLKVTDVMENSPPSVPVETPLRIVTELLKASPIVVITDKGKTKGVVTKADVVSRLAK